MSTKAEIFKWNDKWRIKIHGKEVAEDILPKHIEEFLGVIGGPEVIVVRQIEDKPYPLHITVKNGFIDRAELVGVQTNFEWEEDGKTRTSNEVVVVPVNKFPVASLNN